MKRNKFVDFMIWLFIWVGFLSVVLYFLIRIIGY